MSQGILLCLRNHSLSGSCQCRLGTWQGAPPPVLSLENQPGAILVLVWLLKQIATSHHFCQDCSWFPRSSCRWRTLSWRRTEKWPQFLLHGIRWLWWPPWTSFYLADRTNICHLLYLSRTVEGLWFARSFASERVAHHSFMEACRRPVTCASEGGAFMTPGNSRSQSINLGVGSWSCNAPRVMWGGSEDAGACSGLHYRRWIPKLRNQNIL